MVCTFRSTERFILVVIGFAAFTDGFIYGLIVPVAPTVLHQKAGLPEEQVQRWTAILLSLYGASAVILSPICGLIADGAKGRRRTFLVGIVSLAAATALLCVGTHIVFWIIGRLLQGASAAFTWTVGMAILVDSFEIEMLGRTMGSVTMAMVVGIMMGPLVGGVLYEHWSIYGPYSVAFGLIAIDFALRVLMVEPKSVRSSNSRFKESCPTVDIENDQRRTVPTRSNSVSNADHESSGPSNTTSTSHHGGLVTLLRSPRMIIALWVYLVTSIMITVFDSFLPLFVQETFGWKQTAQGLILLPLSIPSFIDPMAGYIIDKWPHSRRYLTAGALFACVAPISCLRFVDETSITDKILLCILLSIIGSCVGITQSPIMVEVCCLMRDMEDRCAFNHRSTTALAYGLLNSSFNLGSTIAPFLGGYLRGTVGWATMYGIIAVPPGVAAWTALFSFR